MKHPRPRRILRENLARLRDLFRSTDLAVSGEERRALCLLLRQQLEEHRRALREVCSEPGVRTAVGALPVAESEAGNHYLSALAAEMASRDPASPEFQASLQLLRRNVELLVEEVEEPLLATAEKQVSEATLLRIAGHLRQQEVAEQAPSAAAGTPAFGAVSRSRRRFRIATFVLSALIALPVLLILAALLGINPIVRRTVESLATSSLKVPVALDQARVNVAGGVHLHRLSVGNPHPFKEVRAFRLDRLTASVTLATLFGTTVEVQELVLANPELIVEFERDKTNWGALFDNLAAVSRAPRPEGERTFIIRRIRILHPIVTIRSKTAPKGVAIHLRNIELRDVGTAPGSPAPTWLVLSTIFRALIAGAIEQWTGAPPNLSGILESDVGRGARAFEEQLAPPEKEK
jgi:hypothetical protein